MKKIFLAALLVLAACGGSDDEAAPPSTTTSTTASSSSTTAGAVEGPDLAAATVTLTEVRRFDAPIAVAYCLDEAYVAEKGGKVKRFADGGVVAELDVSTGNEQGLLGLACSTDDSTGMYVSYTDPNGDSRVARMPQGGGPPTDELLRVEQPAANHNGGNIVFGPDGELWLGLGDGGGGDDTYDNGQRPGALLGSILRVDRTGAGKHEVVVKGVRNPWRFSFDLDNGDLWIGDVGQNRLEEVDHLPAGRIEGANLGWPAFEGTRRNRSDVQAPGAIPPVFEYGRNQGQSVVGGYVYRGSKIPALAGAYVFADTYAGVIRAIDPSNPGDARDLAEVPGGLVSSFAQSATGELLVLSLDGGIYELR